MKYAYVVTWTTPVPGREELALEFGLEVAEYWGKFAAEGKCTEPEFFFFPDGHGMWIVKGEFETLEHLWMTDKAQYLLVKGRWLLEEFGYEFVLTGDAAEHYMTRYTEVGKELAFS